MKKDLWLKPPARLKGIGPITLPVRYDSLTNHDRWMVRDRYARKQNRKCYHCGQPLNEDPPKNIQNAWIDWSAFPEGFLDHPIHLHHSHLTGMTIGAVHARCNAVLWQYHGE